MSVPSPAPQTPRTPSAPIVASTRKGTVSRSIGFTPVTPGASEEVNGWRGEGSPRGGPEKTVGGFEKKDLGSAGEKDKDGKASLAHVPCRFFKQGACTAGANCPFSHTLPEPGKKEVCQWFLKGNCKFGHKCALAHVRPGEPMSMDRKNKKDQQREQREREAVNVGGGVDGNGSTPKNRLSLPLGTSPDGAEGSFASPVPIRSALSSAMQSPPTSSGSHQRISSSPMREPFGPPSAGLGGSPAGFGRSPIAAFSSSPSRPSPLSASFSGRPSVPGPLALKNGAGAVTNHSPLRPPTSAQSAVFSSSFSHTTLPADRANAPPLSASFADGGSHIKNIWARSEMPAEPLSPRRPILQHPRRSNEMVFLDDDNEDDDHGEDFLPASLNDLLTPAERARRLSRRDSNDSHGISPARGGFLSAKWAASGQGAGAGAERLAQSAGANLGPANFLQSLWSHDGADKRRGDDSPSGGPGPATASGNAGQSLLSQQRAPATATGTGTGTSPGRSVESNFPLRHPPHPSSPSARAFQEHAPGQSLPGGVATALSRLHLHGPSGLVPAANISISDAKDKEVTPPMSTVPLPTKRGDDHDDGLFAMDG